MIIEVSPNMWRCFLHLLLFHSISTYRVNVNKQSYFTGARRTKTELNMAFDTIVKAKSMHESPCSLTSDEDQLSLADYMRLPVDQYVCIKMPLDATLERSGDIESSTFDLTVPPVRFFHLEVSPRMVCQVAQDEHSVTITSKECVLTGSSSVESLNGCFKLDIKTVFKWVDKPSKKAILSSSDILVEVDPPAPFKYFGKTILEKTGTLAMNIALRQIENAFVDSLAKDFEKWANNREYRLEREIGACSVNTEEAIESTAPTLIIKDVGTNAIAELGAAVHKDGGTKSDNGNKTDETDFLRMVGEKNVDPNPAPKIVVDGMSSSILPYASTSLYEATLQKAEAIIDLKEVKAKPVAVKDPETEEICLIVNKDQYVKQTIANEVRVRINETPYVLTDDICLMPGEPQVRIEEAPNNARRIFTGIDIIADVDRVWEVLRNYEKLQDVVPSIVSNEVLYRTPDGGARLKQVGGAKVLPGVTFKAKTVLDVRIYGYDAPLAPHMMTENMPEGTPRKELEEFYRNLPLKRDVFPRPYALTSLPHLDLTMQNVPGEGDFDFYQGVWRMQALPGCAPEGKSASRLTYAVELRPKGFLPVGLIEGRIASDLIVNLQAIKDYVEALPPKEKEKVLPVIKVIDVSQKVGNDGNDEKDKKVEDSIDVGAGTGAGLELKRKIDRTTVVSESVIMSNDEKTVIDVLDIEEKEKPFNILSLTSWKALWRGPPRESDEEIDEESTGEEQVLSPLALAPSSVSSLEDLVVVVRQLQRENEELSKRVKALEEENFLA